MSMSPIIKSLLIFSTGAFVGSAMQHTYDYRDDPYESDPYEVGSKYPEDQKAMDEAVQARKNAKKVNIEFSQNPNPFAKLRECLSEEEREKRYEEAKAKANKTFVEFMKKDSGEMDPSSSQSNPSRHTLTQGVDQYIKDNLKTQPEAPTEKKEEANLLDVIADITGESDSLKNIIDSANNILSNKELIKSIDEFKRIKDELKRQ